MELAEYRRMADVEDVHWWYRSTRALLQQLVAGSLAPGGRFLDVGCGTGATGGWLGERGELVALDFELEALTLFGERHSSIGRLAADAGRLPLADGHVRRGGVRDRAVPPVDRRARRRRAASWRASCALVGCCACGSRVSSVSTAPTTG